MQTPVVGIIAEYNPFHIGHKYHLSETKKKLETENIIVVLSSNFVQRGEASLLNKWERTKVALDCGASLVLELPCVFSSHNAGTFSSGAVDILNSTGIVTHLSFGLEDPEWDTQHILYILNEEPKPFKSYLKYFLEKGYSFVESRSLALDKLIPGTYDIIKKSNNLLGLSYLQRIYNKKYDIVPFNVKRIGSMYNDSELSNIPSATAIRKAINENNTECALSYLPEESAFVTRNAINSGHTVSNHKKLWELLRYILIRTDTNKIAEIAEISEGLEYKLKKEALSSSSFSEWIDACTSKRYPSSRIKRSAIHILLNLPHWWNRAFQRIGVPYIRVLGMDKNGKRLLREMKKNATLPIISRYGEASHISEYARALMQYELNSCEIWEQLTDNGNIGREHTQKIIIHE
ncbi:MAG: nucleotidyltransferase [Synergistaceae bacterium]